MSKKRIQKTSKHNNKRCENSVKTTVQNGHYKREVTDNEILEAFYEYKAIKFTVAKNLGMSRTTLDKRIKESKELQEAYADAQEAAIEHVESKLMSRIDGYDHKEIKVFQYQGEIITHTVTKHYPPDVNAANIYLKANAKHKGYEGKIEKKEDDEEEQINIIELPNDQRNQSK